MSNRYLIPDIFQINKLGDIDISEVLNLDFPLFKHEGGCPSLGFAWCLLNNMGVTPIASITRYSDEDSFLVILETALSDYPVANRGTFRIAAAGYTKKTEIINITGKDFETDLFEVPNMKNKIAGYNTEEDVKFSLKDYSTGSFCQFNNSTKESGACYFKVYKDRECTVEGWEINSEFINLIYSFIDPESEFFIDVKNNSFSLANISFFQEDNNISYQKKDKTTCNKTIKDEDFKLKLRYEAYVKPIIEYLKEQKVGISEQTDNNENLKDERISYHHNIIISGAPGTGKSYIVENNIVPKIIENNIHTEDDKEYMSRIVFTSSTSYEDFFGSYKPTPIEFNGEPRITYKFVPGIFTSILLKAQKDKENNYVLVIEEINRADVYDVFGQIFQLLDRKDSDKSEYGIDVPEDAKDYFKTDEKIIIPSNLYIVCTMNSADQGVRVLDTAFKRRFSMAYMDIDSNLFCSSKVPIKDKEIKNNAKTIDSDTYHKLRKEINRILIDEQFGEDRLIAERFVKVNKEIEEVEFVINILGYLIQNVYRNRDLSSAIFSDPEQRQMVSLLEKYSEKGLEAVLSSKLNEILNKDKENA